MQSLFDKLNKQVEKTLKAADSLGTPRVYIKMLVELEVGSRQYLLSIRCLRICLYVSAINSACTGAPCVSAWNFLWMPVRLCCFLTQTLFEPNSVPVPLT